MDRVLPWALVLPALLGGCRESPESAAAPSAPTAAAETSSPPRRPTRRFWVVDVDERCFVYWTEGETRSVDAPIACPRELRSGEKLHLAGKTCLRQSSVAERSVPVRCPKEILYAERDDRADAGEYALPAARGAPP